ncbi:MAG TPA: phage tail tape measure protein, partial [Alphaproteobacteria bacterium]|nr:phage tail tape measure protein [Alphaproteobacteria bacterium]
MAVLDKVKYVISADSTEFRRELKKAGTVFDRWQRRHRRSLRALKRITAASVLGLTALTAGLGVKAVRSAARFESSIADAGAKAQATTEQLHALDKAAIKASSSSAFGANDAAKALSIEAQAGLSVKEQIQALRPELDLAAASHTNLGEATTISTKSLRAFRLQASQTGHVADVLTKASVSTNSTVSQLGEALGNAGAIAGQTHQSLETIVSVIGEMQDVGVPAAQAGTAIRSALGKLASTGSKARKELSKFVKVTDSQGQLRQFSSILEDLSRAVPNAQKRVSILSQAFGVKIGPKIVAATAKSADALEKFRQELIHSGGTASSIAAKQLDNFAGQLKVTGGKLDNLGVTVGKIFTPALKAATVTVGELSDKLRENVAAQKTLRNTTTAAAAGLVQSFAAGASIAGHTVDVLTLGYAGASEAADHLTKVTDKLANSLENSAAKAAARAAFGISRLKQQMEELAGKIRENNHSLAEHLRLLAKYHDLRDKVTHQDRISKLKKQASIYDEVNKKLAQQQHLVIQL